jgi:hypothetical protein
LTKRIKDGNGVFTTKINKHSTRKEIEALHIKGSKSEKTADKPQTRAKDFTNLGSIQISNDLFNFTTTGTKRGHLKLDDVEKLHQAIVELLQRYDKGKKYYSFESQLTEVKQKYKAEESYDFGASIKAADQKRKQAVRKAAAKRATQRKRQRHLW